MKINKIGSGRYADCFRITDGHQSVIVKLGYYRENTLREFARYMKSGRGQRARQMKNSDAIQIGNAFGVLTNRLIERAVSPHFVYVYANVDGKHLAQKFGSMIPERMRSATPVQLKYNNLSFLEQFDSDLTQWLRRGRTVNDESVRIAIFGVLYTLAALQHVYPNFRHNDLSTNNVLIKRYRTPRTFQYKIGRLQFTMTTPSLVALTDYDFVHIPHILENERVASGKYRVTPCKNNAYDSHFFLKTVQRVLHARRNLPETKAFLASLPFHKEDRNDTLQVPGMDPMTLLQHPYFSKLRGRPRAGVVTYTFS